MSRDAHRRIGAYAEFTPWKISDDFKEAIRRVDDLSPVMQKIGYAARDEARARLAAGGDGNWAPLAETTIARRNRPSGSHSGTQPGIGSHGGFSASIIAFFGKRNAGWKTPAPHAHLFAHGIKWHTGPGGKRTGLYRDVSGKRHGLKRRRSEGETRRISRTLKDTQHAPAREFDYISKPLADRALNDTADYVLFFRGEDSMIERCVETRLLEACLRETKACFNSGGWTILGYPLMPGDSVATPQINVFPVALNFEQGVGGASNTRYGVNFRFFFPRELLMIVEGQRTYLDEIHKLKNWLNNGGTRLNKNGRLVDPDNPSGLSINREIVDFITAPAAIDKGNGAIFIDAQVLFGTQEDRQGKRIGG